MTKRVLEIAGAVGTLAGGLRAVLDGLPADIAILVNADPAPDADVIVRRCEVFAGALDGESEALIVTILRAQPAGLSHFAHHAANAALWSFTRQAALAWAARRIRINAIGLAVSPFGPFEPQEQAGRAAGNVPASAATVEDVARTVAAMASWASMTGQIVRLGAAAEA